LVGGTGLYFRTLETGLSELPPADAAVREQLEAEARDKGWEHMHQRLAGIDPAAAARIHPNDPQRLQRALEVYELTGRSMTELYARETAKPLPYEVIKIILNPADRMIIHKRVKVRFMQMLADGLVDEVQGLYARADLDPVMPSMRMVGYRQIWLYLEGLINYEQMVEDAIVATRQLAKRQLTWLRREENACWFDSQQDDLQDRVLKFLGENRKISTRM
jgi:tRNA dimethylallyltransferase